MPKLIYKSLKSQNSLPMLKFCKGNTSIQMRIQSILQTSRHLHPPNRMPLLRPSVTQRVKSEMYTLQGGYYRVLCIKFKTRFLIFVEDNYGVETIFSQCYS